MRVDHPLIPPPAQGLGGPLTRRAAPATTAVEGELLRERSGSARTAHVPLMPRAASVAEQALTAYRGVAALDEPATVQLVGVDVYV